MGNDDSRASINSGHVRKQEDDGFIQRLPKEDGSKHPNPDECNGIDKPNKLDEAARKKLLADLLDGDPSELLLSIINVEQQEISKQWSGILPDPESFKQYPKDVQEHMVAWNDAQILDESKRLDKFADAAVKNVRVDSILNFILNLSFAVGSFAAFIITGNVWSYGMLAIPGISIAVNLVNHHRARKKIDGENKGDS